VQGEQDQVRRARPQAGEGLRGGRVSMMRTPAACGCGGGPRVRTCLGDPNRNPNRDSGVWLAGTRRIAPRIHARRNEFSAPSPPFPPPHEGSTGGHRLV